MNLLKLFTLTLTLISMVACSSTTLIQSSDPEAKVYVDGNYVGKGSYAHTDTKIVGSTTHVTLKKDGCHPQSFMFSRSEEFDVGACIGGVFVLVPFLWIQKYRPSRTFEFQCDKVSTK